jgi:hypothetical protein
MKWQHPIYQGSQPLQRKEVGGPKTIRTWATGRSNARQLLFFFPRCRRRLPWILLAWPFGVSGLLLPGSASWMGEALWFQGAFLEQPRLEEYHTLGFTIDGRWITKHLMFWWVYVVWKEKVLPENENFSCSKPFLWPLGRKAYPGRPAELYTWNDMKLGLPTTSAVVSF